MYRIEKEREGEKEGKREKERERERERRGSLTFTLILGITNLH